MSYVVEKDVPIERDANERFPFKQMQPGDSFLIPDSDGIKVALVNTYMRRYEARNPGASFKSRKVDGGRRVWRTA